MQSSTPSSLSRHRPAILVVAGIAAAFAGYHIFNISQASATTGLHRSNAVRRPNARQRRHAAQAARIFARLNGEAPIALGTFDLNGTPISLDPSDVASSDQLRNNILQVRPDMPTEDVEDKLDHIYDEFLIRLHLFVSPTRQLSQPETDLLARWVLERFPDNTPIARAVERQAAALPLPDGPALDGAESVAATDLSWASDDGTDANGDDLDGQILQRTLYHIAEDRARQEGVVHRGITCNGCDEKPIRGIRWHCANCPDFDLCSNCEATNSHTKTHIFYKIRVPAPYLSINKQETLYPGKPHMMPPSVESALKRRLVTETKMEAEEIEALWDQFSCLAGTEWPSDANNIGWALDRRAFNHAFIPRYNSFVAAPNLIYDRIFAYYDTDKNGLIGFEEWIRGLDGMHASSGHDKAKIVFDGYDVDGDGYISRRDVLRIFRAYYAIEKEATRNYIAEITEDLSMRNALDTIRSSQPLGSAFPPHDLSSLYIDNHRLHEKNEDDPDIISAVAQDDNQDIARREDILKFTDIRNMPPGALSQNEQDRIVLDRWARRQFYLDEEEGMPGPELQSEELSGNSAETISGRQTESAGSSSSINSSIASPIIGDMGGFVIPEPEKDLGQEVMYQITQQGFNELLDPLFLDRENNAMDAHATRTERRRHATSIDHMVEHFRTEAYDQNRAVCKIGFFRYAKCVIETFCIIINDTTGDGGFTSVFNKDDGTQVGRKEARDRLKAIFTTVDQAFVETVNVSEDWKTDEMTLWNTELCRRQLSEEVVSGVLTCVSQLGWITEEVQDVPEEQTTASEPPDHRDPTMPQFRPNSSIDMDSNPHSNLLMAVNEELQGAVGSPVIESSSNTFHQYSSGEDHILFRPKGPFFALAVPDLAERRGQTDVEATADDSEQASGDMQSSLSSLPDTQINHNNDPLTENGSSQPPIVDDSSIPQRKVVNVYSRSNNPAIHLFHITTDNDIQKLTIVPKSISYCTNPFLPSLDPQILLFRHIREIAMDSSSEDSEFHTVWLASLETAQQEIDVRKGRGLINLKEFEEYISQGRLRFLEAWMEWVSI